MALLLLSFVTLALVILLLIKATVEWYRDINRPGIPPGHKGHPILYNFINVWRNKDRIYDFTLSKSLELKSLVWTGRLIFAAPRTIVVADPRCVEYILKDNFSNYVKGEYFEEMLREFLGEGIFNTNGEKWKQQRQVASHLFTVKELRGMTEVFTKHGNALADLLESFATDRRIVDMQDYFSRTTLDSIGMIAFGENLDSLHGKVNFADAFNRAQLCIDARAFNPLWKLLPFSKSETDLKKSIKILNDFAYDLISRRKKDPNLHSKRDLLSRYLCMTTNSKGEISTEDDPTSNNKDVTNHTFLFSDSYLRDMILNMMLAGRDTTAQTLTWCFYLLSQSPRVEGKLVQEINSVLNGEAPSFENIKQMKYLQMVVDETLRLYPPVPIDPKSAVNDDVLPNGYQVRAGDNVEWNQWVMGHHPEFWDCPNEFRPERWDGENGGKPIPKGNVPPFVPFQYGPRTCLGIQFAYQEVKLVTCILLSRGIRLRLKEGHQVHYKSAITISVKNGLPMYVVLDKQQGKN
eukprot:TRINITY_DN7017_c0_g1_i1.p1 TRINITY_DN7017_c0_g1~~TRINITY_DN7017_c0_g1_i1.p1  ORF type:complete len:519 (-),score=124.62 TRINITY_DN7017_c0_g1_i1:363-1919(-)